MEIKELKIEGFKSLGSIQLNDLNPFTVFVGPNGAGKSNIFEALEFWSSSETMIVTEVIKMFGGLEQITNANGNQKELKFQFKINDKHHIPSLKIELTYNEGKPLLSAYNRIYTTSEYYSELKSKINIDRDKVKLLEIDHEIMYYQHFSCSRLFIDNTKMVKRIFLDDSKLASDASNLEKVLKRILKNEIYKAEIEEILQLLIPGFDRIDVVTEELSGSDNLVVYEQSLKKPLTKRLISDGTYNIIALITAIYQSEEPQFLCIEEPENGLNPKVVKELVTIFRQKCQEKGHFIWLNTHSQTLVSELHPDEIVLVDKVDGLTQVKQIKGMNLHGMKMDEALMTNALGGGIPW